VIIKAIYVRCKNIKYLGISIFLVQLTLIWYNIVHRIYYRRYSGNCYNNNNNNINARSNGHYQIFFFCKNLMNCNVRIMQKRGWKGLCPLSTLGRIPKNNNTNVSHVIANKFWKLSTLHVFKCNIRLQFISTPLCPLLQRPRDFWTRDFI